jgi:hypothetical protein
LLDSNNTSSTPDLTALITGPNAGRFTQPQVNCDANAPVPLQASIRCSVRIPRHPIEYSRYREITVNLSRCARQFAGWLVSRSRDAGVSVLQANSTVRTTTVAGQDAFCDQLRQPAAIGAEIYANRVGVGPMGSCADCKFEEFFLSSWSVGDPAMVVDRPANATVLNQAPPPAPTIIPPAQLCSTTQLGDSPPAAPDPKCANAHVPPSPATPYSLAGLSKATRVYYPDDPSNVYHTYMNDHVKFRILHGGRDVSHVHHQHAHQWLQSPNSDQGSYLDSQMISPGASYTLEMVYNGSGNRNKTVGDSIFTATSTRILRQECGRCGAFTIRLRVVRSYRTEFRSKARAPCRTVRSRPGSPTPALVPMPTLAMAPMPSAVFIDNGQIVYGTRLHRIQPARALR